MKLYFLRHGIAVDRARTGKDLDRPLTKSGRYRVSRIARAMAKLEIGVQEIITSPAVRALQTARLVARELHLEQELEVNPVLTHGFDLQGLERLLRLKQKLRAILLVGHEPDFSKTICQLMGGGRLRLKKAGLARVDLDPLNPESAKLVWLAPPKLLVDFGSIRGRGPTASQP